MRLLKALFSKRVVPPQDAVPAASTEEPNLASPQHSHTDLVSNGPEVKHVPPWNEQDTEQVSPSFEFCCDAASKHLRDGRHRAALNMLSDFFDEKRNDEGFMSLISQCYRDTIRQEMTEGQYGKAKETYLEFLVECSDKIGEDDRVLFETIKRSFSGDTKSSPKKGRGDSTRLSVEKLSGELRFSFSVDAVDGAVLLNRRKCAFVCRSRSNGNLYLNRTFDPDANAYASSRITRRGKNGLLSQPIELKHGVYRFSSSSVGDAFVVSSDTLTVYKYSWHGDLVCSFHANKIAEDKYSLRCVSISPQGEWVVLSAVDTAYLYRIDNSFRFVHSWRTPRNPEPEPVIGSGRKSQPRQADLQKYSKVLGVKANAPIDEKKRVFRAALHKWHPDHNPDNEHAEAVTRSLIEAYEYLTDQESAAAILSENGAGNGFTWQIRLQSLHIAEDWIYSVAVSDQPFGLVLGCYSGHVFCIGENRKLSHVFDCGKPVTRIYSRGDRIYARTDGTLFAFYNGELAGQIEMRIDSEVEFSSWGPIVISRAGIQICDSDCIPLMHLSFKDSIRNLYWDDDALCVLTARKAYRFDIGFDS